MRELLALGGIGIVVATAAGTASFVMNILDLVPSRPVPGFSAQRRKAVIRAGSALVTPMVPAIVAVALTIPISINGAGLGPSNPWMPVVAGLAVGIMGVFVVKAEERSATPKDVQELLADLRRCWRGEEEITRTLHARNQRPLRRFQASGPGRAFYAGSQGRLDPSFEAAVQEALAHNYQMDRRNFRTLTSIRLALLMLRGNRPMAIWLLCPFLTGILWGLFLPTSTVIAGEAWAASGLIVLTGLTASALSIWARLVGGGQALLPLQGTRGDVFRPNQYSRHPDQPGVRMISARCGTTRAELRP